MFKSNSRIEKIVDRKKVLQSKMFTQHFKDDLIGKSFHNKTAGIFKFEFGAVVLEPQTHLTQTSGF